MNCPEILIFFKKKKHFFSQNVIIFCSGRLKVKESIYFYYLTEKTRENANLIF